MALAKNPVISGRSKHIDIRCHFIRNYLANENGLLKYINTTENIADVFTKDLHGQKFKYLVSQLYGSSRFKLSGGVEEARAY